MRSYPTTHAPSTPGLLRDCSHCGQPFATTESLIRRGSGKYCSRACLYSHRVAESYRRFWTRFEQRGDCRLWTGNVHQNGYGSVEIGGQTFYVHRLAYQLTYGPIPNGLLICHDCDRFYPPGDFTYRRCFVPEHLWQGTSTDNNRDTVAKGRGNQRGVPHAVTRKR